MTIAGFGFRDAATLASLLDAYAKATRHHAASGVASIAAVNATLVIVLNIEFSLFGLFSLAVAAG